MDMSTWQNLDVDVMNDLSLDSRNVRLDTPDGVPESDIIQDLFTNEKALNLVENISKLGFLTHEVPIVVTRAGKLVVVEGNRRIAALKAIQNPYLAPEHQSRIIKFSQNIPDRDDLLRISVKKAPSQDDADQLIAALHTGNQRVAWTPARQAAFFQAQLNAGKTPAGLIEQYPTIDVRKFITRSLILELFRSVDYEDPSLGDFAGKRRFPVSILARLYENENFLNLAGIRIQNETGEISLLSSPPVFKRLATRIISDIRDGTINTRTLNKLSSARYIEYLEGLTRLIEEQNEESGIGTQEPTTSTSEAHVDEPSGTAAVGTRSPRSHSAGNSQSAPQNDIDKDKAKSVPKKRNYLNTDNLSVPSTFPASIHAITQELATINIQKFPNATLDLLRTFLEKTIKAYAENLGEEIRRNSNDQGFVYLSNCLVWLESHFRENGLTAYIQPVQKLRGGRYGFLGSKAHLDATNHNHHIFATDDDVRDSWASIEGIMKAVLKV